MFTGIVEEIGKIININKLSNGAVLKVHCNNVLNGTKIGDSIAVNGVCLTVTEISDDSFSAFASYETLKITAFANYNCGQNVNLERALALSDRLGGHFVMGHIDGIGQLQSVNNVGDAYKFTFSVDESLKKYIVKKGSITIDGISLTVSELDYKSFCVAVIPHTYENTCLYSLKNGDRVNIETDILGKYVEKFLLSENNKTGITYEFLARNGF